MLNFAGVYVILLDMLRICISLAQKSQGLLLAEILGSRVIQYVN